MSIYHCQRRERTIRCYAPCTCTTHNLHTGAKRAACLDVGSLNSANRRSASSRTHGEEDSGSSLCSLLGPSSRLARLSRPYGSSPGKHQDRALAHARPFANS